MKLIAGLIWAFCLISVRADTLRISIDTNWVQPYVVSGNSNEMVARVILDGTSLERDVYVNDIPLTLTLSNMPYSAFTNCVLWGQPQSIEHDGVFILVDPRSGTLNYLRGTNTFQFSLSLRIFPGEQRTLYLTCGIFRSATNSSFRWGVPSEYRTITFCTLGPNDGITCSYSTNQIFRSDGPPIAVELLQGTPSWIPVIARGAAKLSISLGSIDHTGAVRPGLVQGQGRPFRKYSIQYTSNFQDWYYNNAWLDAATGNFYYHIEADADGKFSSTFQNYIHQQRARFFRAYEDFE